ncbi:MAG: PEP-CTERM sorting domain-containing protein, partial [Caulobacteraceae bacterium]
GAGLGAGSGAFGGGGGAAFFDSGGGGGGYSGGGGAGQCDCGGGGGGSFFTSGYASHSLVDLGAQNDGAGMITIDFLGAPVPEPASWALLAAGFLGLGAALRGSRRKRGQAMV